MQRCRMFRHAGGCWGLGVSKGIRKGTESKQAPRTCSALTGSVRQQTRTQLLKHVTAHDALDSFHSVLFSSAQYLVMSVMFLFLQTRRFKNAPNHRFNALQGIVPTQTKKQPPTTFPLTTNPLIPELWVQSPHTHVFGERRREEAGFG